MNPVSLINILLHAGAAVPGIQQEITDALTANWSKGVVQDFAQGVDILSNIVKTVAAGFEPSATGVEETVTATPPAPVHTPEEIEAAKAIIAAATAQQAPATS